MKLTVFCILCHVIPSITGISLFKFEKEAGVLHSLLHFVKWHTQEESIINSFEMLTVMLRAERKFIKKYLYPNNEFFKKFKQFRLANRFFKTEYLNTIKNLELHVRPMSKPVWVGSADLVFSMMAFTYIQEFNLIDPERMSNGLRVDTHFGGTLKERHFMETGVFALFRDLFDMSVEWLELGRRKVDKLTGLLKSLIVLAIQQVHNLLVLFFI